MVCRYLDRRLLHLSSPRNWRTWPWTKAALRPWSVKWQGSRSPQCAGTRRGDRWALHRRLRWGSKMAAWDWCCMEWKRPTQDDTLVLHRIILERIPPRLMSLLMVYSLHIITYLLTYLFTGILWRAVQLKRGTLLNYFACILITTAQFRVKSCWTSSLSSLLACNVL